VKAYLAVPVTAITTFFPITGGYGVTSTEVTVPNTPPQSLTATGYSIALTNLTVAFPQTKLASLAF
jgi:hypothetical protein